MIAIAPHPLLDAVCFVARSRTMAGELGGSPALDAALDPVGPHPIVGDDVRTSVRALLRHGGYKPSGRGKPASEYLVGVFAEGRFPRINALVDVCNVVSLHSGLPISLLDLDLLQGVAADGLSIRVMPERTSYVFNLSGQTIDASGLLALCDRDGPAGTPVKDAQRTKTHAGTVNTLTVIWGSRALPGRAASAHAAYVRLLESLAGVHSEPIL
ncbi:MAG: hypothetical protein KBG15_10895 [Kofleriaceae bacterium]|nr:hypothetical protein [Kofleriaceae bacterium]